MLKLADYRSRAKGLPDLLPYAALVAPGVVLNKDGSFMAGWRITGQDTASSTHNELAWISARVSNVVKLLDTGWMLHVDAVRKPHQAYPPEEAGHFPDPVSQLIDDERREFYRGDYCYATQTVLVVTCKADLYAEKIAQQTQVGAQARDVMEKNLELFQNTLAQIEDGLSSVLYLEPLLEYEIFSDEGEDSFIESELLSHLQYCLTGDAQPIRVPPAPMYLDAVLGCPDLIGGIEPQIGNKAISVINIDGYPMDSTPGMLARLDTLPLSWRFSTRFICLSQFDALKEITSYRKGWQQQMFRFIDMMMNNPNARVNRDAQVMRDDAEEAHLEVQSGMVGMGYMTSCIVLLHEDKGLLKDQTREVSRFLQSMGFGVRVESINALDAWLGTLPGNSWSNIRRPLMNTLNLADLLPLATVWTGKATCPCPFYPPQSRCLAVLTTDGSTPFQLNLHVGDIGHTMIVGPTGSGKSTLLALLAAQFRCYPKACIWAFDKGMSMFPLCVGAGGDHYNIGQDDLSFAPLQRIHESDEELAWAANWLASLAELQKLEILPAHRNAIHATLVNLRENPEDMRSMSHFCHVIQDMELREALEHYTRKGAMGTLLDARMDNLQLSRFMTFEIESLMEMGEANLVPVLLYIFRRIEKALSGQPSMLILDEAWIMLGHPVFKAKIREWLKVLRKKNCIVVLATQELSDAVKSGIFDVLTSSCPAKILLPNKEAASQNFAELYEQIGLNNRQISIIAQSVPKQDYYILSPMGRRRVQLSLGRKTLAFVGAADAESIGRIKELRAEHGKDGWQEHWLRERGAI